MAQAFLINSPPQIMACILIKSCRRDAGDLRSKVCHGSDFCSAQPHPSHPEIMEITAIAMSIIITHLATFSDMLIMPRITENPSNNATIKIMIPIQMRIDIGLPPGDSIM
jgi:hypothetical protein